ncbi:aromatic-L-amino-acid decarboxylase isoform X2 [Eurytemora carolleeae]|uniref:aromatic-L-amino-acid decarboxylase isoform X2 n=1 Tax=Eurytemora carolleeae TaxID=1294199 RepID=UPI000C77CC39|nr:aromatic-L-amino-acid decarboxylase isoform X2 [Eurytemora carolleeae]|eukprot:XP_023323819.1 aromatic-L-amino-acid decarboxylase-like isoform X2 [Eurytemora affinis]
MDRPVLPQVTPGYLRSLVPDEAPEKGEDWRTVMKDVDRVIMPGVTHWHHPQFHAYFPTANSYPAIVADILSGSIACIGFSWIASPACTELEMVTMDWLGTALNLPKEFLFSGPGNGGGVIQGTASEATLVAILSARAERLKREEAKGKMDRLVAYCSAQAHSSVERAGMLAGIQMRLVEPDENFSLRGDALNAAIEEDKEKGLIPFCVIATLGTTNSCSFDNLPELGRVCLEQDVWLHVDAAYAGSSFICPEFRPLLDGVEFAESFNFNPHKWMLVNFDCSAMWIKDSRKIVDAFNVDPLYLQHRHQGEIPDYRHWHIPLGRRFRSLKIWFVMRIYGLEGLRKHIREQVELANQFAEIVQTDPRFELPTPPRMGLVCFRVKASNVVNEKLNKKINEAARIHITPAKIRDKYILRFAVCSRFTVSTDIEFAWTEILRNLDLISINQDTE